MVKVVCTLPTSHFISVSFNPSTKLLVKTSATVLRNPPGLQQPVFVFGGNNLVPPLSSLTGDFFFFFLRFTFNRIGPGEISFKPRRQSAKYSLLRTYYTKRVLHETHPTRSCEYSGNWVIAPCFAIPPSNSSHNRQVIATPLHLEAATTFSTNESRIPYCDYSFLLPIQGSRPCTTPYVTDKSSLFVSLHSKTKSISCMPFSLPSMREAWEARHDIPRTASCK